MEVSEEEGANSPQYWPPNNIKASSTARRDKDDRYVGVATLHGSDTEFCLMAFRALNFVPMSTSIQCDSQYKKSEDVIVSIV